MLNLTSEQQKALNKAMKEHIEKKTAESLVTFDKTLSLVVDKLESEGWTLPSELGIYAVNVIGQTEKISDINEFLYSYFVQDDYRVKHHMVDSILASHIKSGIKKMTTECWVSFQNGLYAICSTALLSVIEGILSEFSEDKQDVRMMKVCQRYVDTLPANGSIIEKHTWISYNRFIRNLYEKSDFSACEPEKVNRHWLLHGRSEYEINELDCIRLFNAVASLCMIVNKRLNEITTPTE